MAINTSKFLEDARRATDKRMAAAETIATKLAEWDQARAAVENAAVSVEAAFRDAERAGWSKSELRQLRPADLAPKPRRRRKAGAPNAASGDAHPEDAASHSSATDTAS